MLERPVNLKVSNGVLEEIIDSYSEGILADKILESIKVKYGLCIGKTTLYRYLKRKGGLRSISETLKLQNRKNLPINEIIRLYVEEKYSIKELARVFSRNWYTIRKILIENNIKLKDWGEINHLFRVKFRKPTILLTENEKSYITGLVIGDFAVYQKSKYTLRITTASTKQAFLDMVVKTFEKYGHIMKTFDKYNNCYKITVDLDLSSFEFLRDAKKDYHSLEKMNKEEFLHFLAGFTDAEGSISIYRRKSRNQIGFNIQIYNTDLSILKTIKSKLENIGFHPNITKIRSIGSDYYKNKIFNHNYEEFRVSLNKKLEIEKLLKSIPLRHPDKIANSKIIQHLVKNRINKLNEFEGQPFTLPKGTSLQTLLEIPAK